jgi:formylglycine-generating enzyme required for sulfatase activity
VSPRATRWHGPWLAFVGAAACALVYTRAATAQVPPSARWLDSIGLGVDEFVLIQPGTFQMGASNVGPDGQPIHQVTITKPFFLQKTEVTQAQWRAVMGSNPSHFSDCGDDCPVDQVSWNDIWSA